MRMGVWVGLDSAAVPAVGKAPEAVLVRVGQQLVIALPLQVFDVAAHEEAFERAGFSEVRWHPPALSPEALKDFDRDYWSTFLDVPPVAFIECIR
jgi:hypothetical protein